MDTAPGSGNELTEKQLKLGYWWITNKLLVKKILTMLLGAVGFSLLAYGAWGFADWFIGSGVSERAGTALLTENLTDYTFFRESNQPKPMVTQSPLVLSSGEGRYDLVAKISNPNHRWWVEFSYKFSGADSSDQIYTEYLLPTDTRYIYVLGVKTERKPIPALEIMDVHWHRVDGHFVQPDYLTWATERLDFTIENPKYNPPDPNSPIPVSRASFRVINGTAYSYVAAPFFVALYSGSRLVGVNRVVATRFLAGSTRDIEASWFTDLPSVTRVEVLPELNIFDNKIYLKPGE
ncbi:MAG: hypothetical protein ABIH87_01105 [bacterium]